MNIFVLDENPIIAAKYHCDKHIVKMAVESNQMLATSYHLLSTDNNWKYFPSDNPYRITHINHPCSKWVRESEGNFRWLLDLALAIGEEHHKRYGKYTKSYHVSLWFQKNIHMMRFPNKKMTNFVICMDDIYKKNSVVDSYRHLYTTGKRHICTWNHTETPKWF
jgi:hypothetical protein